MYCRNNQRSLVDEHLAHQKWSAHARPWEVVLVEFAWPLAKDEYSIESKEGRLAHKVALLDPGFI